MPTIREVITRFGLEVDDKQEKDVKNRIDGLKQGFSGLGKFIGVAIAGAGSRAFFKMGQTAERAEFNLKRMAGIQFKPLRNQFKNIQNELDRTREGASKIVTERQFDIAAAGFLKVFGKGKDQVDAFGKLFSFAAKQAAITGEEVNLIVEQLQSGIQGGGFDALLELPGFDVFRKQLLEFQQQAIDPGEPGGRIALQNRLKAIMGVITKETADQNAALREVPEILLETDKVARQTKDTFEDLAQNINKLLVPAVKVLNRTLEYFNKLVGGDKVITPLSLAKDAIGGIGPTPQTSQTPLADQTLLGQLLRFARPQAVGPGGGGDTYNITMNNDIKSTDPVKVTQEVAKGFQAELKKARQTLQITEDK